MKLSQRTLVVGVIVVLAVGTLAVMSDRTVNDLMNWLIRRQAAASALAEYQTYPPGQTALILIDTQHGFLADEPELTETLVELVDFARRQQYRIIYTPYSADAVHRFPTRAHDQLRSRLGSSPEASDFPERIAPRDDDVVLPARSSFSAFSGTGLNRLLKTSGLEHLILVGPLTLITLDSSVRDGAQYDYHVTVLRDGAGAAASETTRAEFTRTLWRYAQSVLTLQEFVSLVESD